MKKFIFEVSFDEYGFEHEVPQLIEVQAPDAGTAWAKAEEIAQNKCKRFGRTREFILNLESEFE